MKLLRFIFAAAVLAATASAQQAVRVDNTTKVVSEPSGFFSANAAAISSAVSPLVSVSWSQLTGQPTTIAGYGITDGVTLTGSQTLTNKTFVAPVLGTPASGNGSNLTALNATQLTSGSVPAARMPALTGDVTTSAGAVATTLATVNSNVGSFGSATQSLTATVNAKGLVTAISAQTVTPAWTSVTGKPTTVATSGLTDAVASSRTISTTAPLTGGGDLSANRTLAISTATTSAIGAVQLATTTEVQTGTDTAKAVTSAALAAINPRGPPDWVYSDGNTSGRAQIHTMGVRGNIAGAAAATWIGWVDVPSSNPAVDVSVAILSGSTAPSLSSGAASLEINMSPTGQLYIVAVSAVSRANVRLFLWSGFRAAYSGQRVWLEVRFTKGTSNPVVRVNGSDISASFSASTNGTPPEWLDSGLVATFGLSGYLWPAGPAPLGQWILGTLTDAESEAWRLTGRAPAWVVPGGSMSRLSAYANSVAYGAADTNTTAVTANTFHCSGSVESGARTGGAGAWFLRATATGTGGANIGVLASNISEGYLSVRSYALRFWARSSVNQTVGIAFKLANSGTSGVTNVAITTSWAEYMLFIPVQNYSGFATGNQLNIAFGVNTAGTTVDLDDVESFFAGALTLPTVQPGSLGDASTIGTTPARLVGMSTITERRTGQLSGVLTWSGTHEGKSLLGGTCVPANAVITRVTTKADAASSGSGITVGTTNSATRWVAANTFTTAKKLHTLANALPAGSAAGDLDIVVDPDTANYTGTVQVTVDYVTTTEAP